MLDRARRARRSLGVVTALALVAMATSTHWPGLRLGTPSDPGPDKILHMVSFGLLTAGAWFSGWFRSLPLLWVVGVLWAVVDEWTQGFAIVDRVSDLEDWWADVMGVTLAVAFILATRPLGGWEARRRRAARDMAMAELFSRWWAWPAVALGTMIGAAGALPVFSFVGARSWAMPNRQVVITGMVVVGIAAAHAAVEILLRATYLKPRPMLPDRVMGRLVLGPALLAFGMLILITAVSQLVLILRPHFAPAALVDEWYRRRSPTLRAAMDLAIILFLAAWATHRARRNIAARIDRAHLACVRCDQALTGATVLDGAGTCPECGTRYELPPAGA